MEPAVYHLLTLGACIDSTERQYQELARKAQTLADWERVPALAESHGLAPLLYLHLTRAGIPIPTTARRELQGLVVRCRHANRVRMQALCEILAAWEAAGIEARVLKGAALAHILYLEPGLRPMSDLDLLVATQDANRAQSILGEIGFFTCPSTEGPLPKRHLQAARTTDGVQVNVETHPRLHFGRAAVLMTIDGLPRQPFSLCPDAPTAYTLRPQEMLIHLCYHLTEHINIATPHRLIWMTDIVGLAERFAAEIDWQQVRAEHPLALNLLSILHFTIPLSQEVLNEVGIGPPPRGVGQDFQGWPRTSINQQRAAGKGAGRILRDTFAPPEWWLRLHYGLHARDALFWHRWIRHPLEIAGWVKHLLAGRLGLQSLGRPPK